MGDRVLFQVVSEDRSQYSPVIYGHWCGDRAPEICDDLRHRMQSRRGDVQYTAARLVQEMIGDDGGALSFGMWNATHILTEEDSHGDAGVVLIYTERDGLRFECLGGYLTLRDGRPVARYTLSEA